MVERATKEPQRPFFGTLDLTRVPRGDSDESYLLTRLRQIGRYKEGLLFTGVFDIDKRAIRRFGADSADRRDTFAYTEAELLDPPSPVDKIFLHAYGEDTAILIYDGSKMESHLEPARYIFKEGIKPIDALVAAFYIK